MYLTRTRAGCFSDAAEGQNGIRYHAWLQMVVARLYVRLSYEDIALILSVNDPDRDRYEQRINGEPPTPFDADKLRSECEELSARLNSERDRNNFLFEHFYNEWVAAGVLVEIRAGMERAKKPAEQHKLDLCCKQYIDELPTAEIEEIYGWANRQARVELNWSV